jgi:hypothetical protein
LKSAQCNLTPSAVSLEALLSGNLQEKGNAGLPDFGK